VDRTRAAGGGLLHEAPSRGLASSPARPGTPRCPAGDGADGRDVRRRDRRVAALYRARPRT